MSRPCRTPGCDKPAKPYYKFCSTCLRDWDDDDELDNLPPVTIPERTYDYRIFCMVCPYSVYEKPTRALVNLWMKAGLRCGKCGGPVAFEEVPSTIRSVA